METIKKLEKEIEESSTMENTDVEEAKLQTLKEVEKLINEIFYYETRDGMIPIISIDKVEEFQQKISGFETKVKKNG